MNARARAAIGALAAVGLLLAPPPAYAHTLGTEGMLPLPLVVYIAGAALAVALSFGAAMLGSPSVPAAAASRRVHVPGWLRMGLRGLGLLAWLWILAQVIVGGSSTAEVSSLFVWTYGWIGVAIVSALVFPAWRWLNPWATVFDIGAAFARRIGVAGGQPSDYPARLGHWPAVIGFGAVIWLELVARVLDGPLLGLIVVAYSVFTLAMMALFGRDTWLAHGETFSVWFGTLNRLAPLGAGDERTLERRPFGAGLATEWPTSLVVLVGLGAASIIFDGFSQTQLYFQLFGLPGVLFETLLLAVFCAVIVVPILSVSRWTGTAAVGAGIVPVAVGYLIAHYLPALLQDGQRIVVALSDPFQLGWDLFGTAYFVPSLTLPASVVWTIQMAAVVGGHVVGAWLGHALATRHDKGNQVALALLMVALTTLTLWSLGQALRFVDDPEESAQVTHLTLG